MWLRIEYLAGLLQVEVDDEEWTPSGHTHYHGRSCAPTAFRRSWTVWGILMETTHVHLEVGARARLARYALRSSKAMKLYHD